MTRPNPLWGIHVVPGALIGALVGRRDDGSYEVLEELHLPASTDHAELLGEALGVLDRRGVRGRAALIAIPDTEGCYTTAEIPDDELYLNEDELFRELYEYTPFEPEDGVIVYTRVASESERKYAVCALPVAYMNGVMAELAAIDPGFHGMGLTSASLVRGARAVGLVAEHGFLLDVQPRLSVLYAMYQESCIRYMIPVGIEDTRKDATAAAALGRDVLQQVSYHLEQHLGEQAHDILDPQKDIVLVGPHVDRDLRSRLAAIFVDRLAPADWRPGAAQETITGPGGTELDPEQALRDLAAIGAALEAYQSSSDRLVLRHPPDDVPEYTGESRPWMLWAAAALVVVALGAAGFFLFGDDDAGPRDEDAAAPADGAEERLATMRHAARRSSYAQAVETLLDLSAAVPAHLRLQRAEIHASDLDYDVTLTLHGEPRMADVAAMGAALDGLAGVSDAGGELDDGALYLRYTAHPRSAPPPDTANAPRVPARPPGTPLLGVQFVRQRLAAVGHLAPAADEASGETPDEIEVRLRADAAVEALAALGYPVDSAPPEDVTLVLDGDDTLLTATMGGPAAGSAQLTEAQAGYLRRAAGRADALSSLDFARAARALTPLATGPAPLSALPTAAGRVRVSYAAGAPQRVLERGPADGSRWEAVATLGAAAGDVIDHVPGPEGDYVWRVRAGARVEARSAAVNVPIPVAIELSGKGAGNTVRFTLSRDWKGDTATTSVLVGVGDAIAAVGAAPGGAPASLAFATPWRVTAIRTTTVREIVDVEVPAFRPDGKVERGADGEPRLERRQVERGTPRLEVEAESPDHPTRTWVRKMTDG